MLRKTPAREAGTMVDAPVPEQGGGCGARQSADDECDPGGGADVSEGWRLDLVA